MPEILLWAFGIGGFIIVSWYVLIEFTARRVADALARAVDDGVITQDQARGLVARLGTKS